MTGRWARVALPAVFLAPLVGCSCSEDVELAGDGSVGDPDATTTLPDGRVVDVDGGSSPAGDGGWGSYPDGGCFEVTCQDHLYACADCMDNDGDGLVDAFDPDCLGACDNNEAGFDLLIPGGDAQPCALDCYFDQDEGFGNDQCTWDHRCDPLEPDKAILCQYRDPAPIEAMCPETQPAACHDFCGPLTPNGCDCFGCCELPAGSGEYVFIGSVPGGLSPDAEGTCTVERANARDHDSCHPCTPVDDCLNDCGRCELCLGKTTLPDDCFGSPEDGGTPWERCPGGEQVCGVPGDDPCPSGFYCVTGCCQLFE